MTGRVLDVGNCGPDHGAVQDLLRSHFDAEVLQAHGMQDAIGLLQTRRFDLVLVNRIMDRDGTEGLEIIRRIKADAELSAVPVMMISNYSEHQELAVEAGAALGFGKSHLRESATLEKLRPFLG